MVLDSVGGSVSAVDDGKSILDVEIGIGGVDNIADKIRVALDEVNIVLKDSKDGTIWEVK